MAIVEVGDFQDYARDKLGSIDHAILSRSLNAAEHAVRAHCRRSFETPAVTATARVFAPVSSVLLDVDDIAVLTTISNDGTTITTGYQLEPLNALNLAGQPVPYDCIRLTSGAWVCDDNRATVTLTARWGWTTVPDAVKEAVMVLAKDIADRREMRGNVAGFGEFGAVRVSSSADALGLLAPFVRWDRAGIA